MKQVYLFKNQYVFAENGHPYYLSDDEKNVFIRSFFRGDGTVTDIQVDLFTGEIWQNRYFFKETYLEKVVPIKKLGDSKNDLMKIPESYALDILKNNKPGLSNFVN